MRGLTGYPGNIRAALNELGHTQYELAARLDIAPETLSRKMRNPKLFRGEEMEKIRKFFCWKNLGGEDENGGRR